MNLQFVTKSDRRYGLFENLLRGGWHLKWGGSGLVGQRPGSVKAGLHGRTVSWCCRELLVGKPLPLHLVTRNEGFCLKVKEKHPGGGEPTQEGKQFS